ncbi:hypothetical protein FOA43_000665 [Brettanomyces nanus]|uniref:Uncharacterized protein n=1 Tax=Eeniella nana TaxID=13502 RepID=A0A875RZ83_EENNA|nr:uncharacterized protein FOA43_000665 [Brettanomyces nanus]QPG73355.1 hypothetical protein FOA43_000665 [Brettanomyces nanus]
MIPPPASATPIESLLLHSPDVFHRRRTHNYMNEVEAQNQASQDDIVKRAQRRLTEQSTFTTMSPQIYKRRCSLTTDIPTEKLGYGYSGDNSTTDFGSSEKPTDDSANDKEDASESNDASTNDDDDTGNESSVSAMYSNIIAGQQGGSKLGSKEGRLNYGKLNESFAFRPLDEEEIGDEEDDENDDLTETMRRRRNLLRRKTSFNFNEYKTDMLRRSLK